MGFLLGGFDAPAPAGAVLLEFDAAALANLSTGLVALPSWLAIACATTGRTTQTSASTFVRSLGANAARARNVGAGTGLSIESARSNKLCGNTDTLTGSATLQQWNTTSSTSVTRTNGQAAPDGTSNAVQFAVTSPSGFTDYCSLKTFAAYGQGGTVSGWIRGIARADATNPYVYISWDSDTDSDLCVGAFATTWARYSTTTALTTKQYPVFEFSRSNPLVHVINATMWGYAMQLELGALYPSSYFPVANGAENQARAADVVSVSDRSLIVPGGYVNLELAMAPHYGSSETAVDHDWLFSDANNRVFFRQSDQKVVMRFGGAADIVSGALTFQRNRGIRVQVEHSRVRRQLIVLDHDTNAVLYDSGALGAGPSIGDVGSIYVGGNVSGAQECADLRLLRIRKAA